MPHLNACTLATSISYLFPFSAVIFIKLTTKSSHLWFFSCGNSRWVACGGSWLLIKSIKSRGCISLSLQEGCNTRACVIDGRRDREGRLSVNQSSPPRLHIVYLCIFSVADVVPVSEMRLSSGLSSSRPGHGCAQRFYILLWFHSVWTAAQKTTDINPTYRGMNIQNISVEKLLTRAVDGPG